MEESNCIICLNEVSQEESEVIQESLPCECKFEVHLECLSQWLSINSKCPLCSLPIIRDGNNVIVPISSQPILVRIQHNRARWNNLVTFICILFFISLFYTLRESHIF